MGVNAPRPKANNSGSKRLTPVTLFVVRRPAMAFGNGGVRSQLPQPRVHIYPSPTMKSQVIQADSYTLGDECTRNETLLYEHP